MNCRVVPRARLGFVGLMVMDWSVAGVTVKVVVPDTLPEEAMMVVVPAAPAVAVPVLLMTATAGAVELQVNCVVRFWVLLSE